MADETFRPGFARATKKHAKLRMAIAGPSGSGKTYTALTFAKALGGRVAVVDTERASASLYSDLFEFDTMELSDFRPSYVIGAISAAAEAGYEVFIFDSWSHTWQGRNGILELVEKVALRGAKGRNPNKFDAWSEVNPHYQAEIDALLAAPMHVIVTLRSKMEYEKSNEGGRFSIRKLGLQPIARDGLEYEFQVFADMDQDNNLVITKTRCTALTGLVVNRPGADIVDTLTAWLGAGAPEPVQVPPGRQPELAAAASGQAASDRAPAAAEPPAQEAPAEAPDWERLTATIRKRGLPVAFREAFIVLAQRSGWDRTQTMSELLSWQKLYQAEPNQTLADLVDEAKSPLAESEPPPF